MDPITAAAIAQGASSLIGGLSGGGGGDKDAGRVSTILPVARMIEGAPLRDKLLAILGQLTSTAPAPFQARDLFNPSTAAPSAGGRTQAQMSLPGDYHFGSGGVDMGIYGDLLNRLGFKHYAGRVYDKAEQQPGIGPNGGAEGTLAPAGPTASKPQTRSPGKLFGVPGLPYGR